jgi:DNA-binding PadR family transcriptional regulator
MHGYEMMKALEERSGGFYTPSAGTIYPTLQLLEDRGLVTAQEVEGKKVYSITDAGREELTKRQQQDEQQFQPPWGRFGKGRWQAPEVQALGSEAAEVARLFAIAGRASINDPEKLAQLRGILATTRKDLSDLIYGTAQQPPKSEENPSTPKAEDA